MLRFFWPRKHKWPQGKDYPLWLSKTQVSALEDLQASAGYEVLQTVIGVLAELRAERLLKPMTSEEANFERGVLFGYRELYDVVERILTQTEKADALKRSRHDADSTTGPDARLWGSSHFSDLWH